MAAAAAAPAAREAEASRDGAERAAAGRAAWAEARAWGVACCCCSWTSTPARNCAGRVPNADNFLFSYRRGCEGWARRWPCLPDGRWRCTRSTTCPTTTVRRARRRSGTHLPRHQRHTVLHLPATARQLLRATASRLHGPTAAALCTATVQLPSGPTATTSLPSPPAAATATTSAPRWVRGSTTTAAAAAIACTPAAAAAAARSSGWRRCRGAAHRGGGGGAERRITARRSQRRARDDDAQAPRLFGGAGTHTQKAWLH